MKEKFLHLESLRGCAAIAVALVHFSNTSALTDNRFIRNAEVMVDFFFVLSGFVIAYNYTDRIVDRVSLLRFQAKRFWRLYPLHLLLLAAFVVLEGAQYAYEVFRGTSGPYAAFSRNTPSAIVTNLLFLHPFFQDDMTFNYPSWSISAEFFTYMAFGLLLIAPKALHLVTAAGVVLASAALLIAADGIVQTRELAIVRCAYGFFIGVLTYRAVRLWRPDSITLGLSAPLVALTVALICVPEHFSKLLLPLLFSACIAALVLEDGASPLKRLLSRPGLVYLGTISYGIYMVHALVWEVMNIVLVKVLGYPLTEAGEAVALTPLEHTTALLLGLTVIVSGAHASYHLVEQRWRIR
jgi:peptidoglycan/LPS O-acetylase OafA/YrhL